MSPIEKYGIARQLGFLSCYLGGLTSALISKIIAQHYNCIGSEQDKAKCVCKKKRSSGNLYTVENL